MTNLKIEIKKLITDDKTDKLTPAQIGTLVHLAMQQLKDNNPLQDLLDQAKDDKKEKQDAKKEKQEELSDLMLDDTKFNRYDYQNIDDNSINNDMTWSFRMDPVDQTTYDGRRYYGERRYYDNNRHHARLEGDFKTNHELNTFRNNP